MRNWLRVALAVVTLLLTARATRAATVQTVDGQIHAGELVSIDAGVLTVNPAGDGASPVKVPLEDIVQVLPHGVAPPGKVSGGSGGSGGPLVDNDGVHASQEVSGTIKLKAGKHPITLMYFQATGTRALRLSYAGPGFPKRAVLESAYAHLPDGAAAPKPAGFTADGLRVGDDVPGAQRQLRYAYFENPNDQPWDSVDEMLALAPKTTGLANRVDLSLAEREEHFGMMFAGYVEVPADGEYTFYLSSDEGSRLYVGRAPVIPAAKIAATPASQPAATRAADDPAPVSVPWQVTLADGDRVTGTIEAWTGDALTLRVEGAAEPIRIPAAGLRELWRADAARPKLADPAADGLTEDTAFVTTDGKGVQEVRGVALGMESGSLLFRYNEDDRRIALDKLAGVTLAAPPAKDDGRLRQVVTAAGGDTFTGEWTAVSAEALTIDTPWAGAVTLPLTRVTSIGVKNGRLVFLADLAPSKVEEVPYFDRVMHYKLDQSLTGGTLRLKDGGVTRGIAVHARCVLRYDLGGKFERFKSRVGFQHPEGRLGRAVVRVLGDGKVLFEDKDFRGDAMPREIDADVRGVKQLTLEADFGEEQDVGDRIVWAEPRLLRAKE